MSYCRTLVPSLLLAACGGSMTAQSEERPAPQPAETRATGKRGVLLMAHGGSEEWNAAVEEAVAPLRARWPVEISYGMAVSSALEQSVARLEARGVDQIAVVRLFVSGDSWREETEYIFGLRPELPPAKVSAHTELPHHGHHGGHKMEAPRPIAHRARIAMSRDGVGDSPLVDRILLDRVQALSTDPAAETVLVIAHGPGDDAEDERWIADMKKRLEPLRTVGAFRRVEVATLREDWPKKRKAAEKRIRAVVEQGNQGGGRVIVVPFRIAGFGPYRDVLEGLTYVSDGKGFLPHENMTRWIAETADGLFAQPAHSK